MSASAARESDHAVGGASVGASVGAGASTGASVGVSVGASIGAGVSIGGVSAGGVVSISVVMASSFSPVAEVIDISQPTKESNKPMPMVVAQNQFQTAINNHTSVRVFRLQKNSQLTIYDIILDGAQINSSLEVILEGEGACVEIVGLFFGTGKQKIDISHTVRHRASHTTSKIMVKGALDESAKASYNGLIEISKGAVGCSGEQSEHTLLLSDKAYIEAVPALKIGNNEVKASHSVSTTYIDELKKFYLESRGLDEAEAVREIVRGHFAEAFERVQDKELRMKLERKIGAKLS